MLGNGAPDLFGTFTAFNANSAGLGIGELLGAASFISIFVAGTVSLISPFKVPRFAFLRDVLFFIGAILWVWYILADNRISLNESIGLILYYCFYVAFVAGGHYHKTNLYFAPIVIDTSIVEVDNFEIESMSTFVLYTYVLILIS